MRAKLANTKLAPVVELEPSEGIAQFLKKDVRRVVTIHMAMFHKLLFQKAELSPELAELFEDVGNRYLDISECISQLRRSHPEANS